MNIPPDIPIPEPVRPAMRGGGAYFSQWRKSLEDMQWQMEKQIATDDGGNERAIDDAQQRAELRPGKGPAAVPLPDVASDSPAQAPAAARADALGRALIEAAQPQAVPRIATVRALIAVGDALAFASAPAPSAPASAGGDSAVERIPPQPLLWNGLPEWPEVVVHASVAGGRISLVIRDRNIEGADATAIYERLRAQLRAAGLELLHLTINGQDVTGDDDAGRLAHLEQ